MHKVLQCYVALVLIVDGVEEDSNFFQGFGRLLFEVLESLFVFLLGYFFEVSEFLVDEETEFWFGY